MNEYIPQVHIVYAYPLDQMRRRIFEDKGKTYLSIDDVWKKTQEIQSLWAEINVDNKIVKSLITILGINPGYDVEFYVAGNFPSMSAPLILSLEMGESEIIPKHLLIEIIIHELIHRFVASPRLEKNFSTKEYWKYIRENYTQHSRNTQNHFIIYAVLEKILPLALSSTQLEIVKDFISKIEKPGYIEAIKLVEEKGSEFFIKEFRDRVVRYD